jgi:hypothetical protein
MEEPVVYNAIAIIAPASVVGIRATIQVTGSILSLDTSAAVVDSCATALCIFVTKATTSTAPFTERRIYL